MITRKAFSTFLILLSMLSLLSLKSNAYDSSDEKRLSDFDDQQKRNQEFDKDRLSDVSEIKKKRAEWEKLRQQGIKEYKEEKHEQAAEISDRNASYKENIQKEKEQEAELEKARKEYVLARDAARRRTLKIAVTEEKEYGLDKPFIRSNKNGRKNLNATGGGSVTSPPAYTPPNDFPTAPGDFEGSAAPPINTGAPEFFQPEDIPPPPPPMDSFDEPIPPPIFEDPEM